MDLITAFPLGDDIAVTLLVLAALSAIVLVLGALVPSRLARDEDSPAIDEGLGARLGAHLSSAGSVLLWVGVPAVVLLLLTPGTTDQRILRAGLLLAGLLLGPLAAWRGIAVQVAALGLAPERRVRLARRLGALTVAGALALGVLPVAAAIWFLQEQASTGLVALAGGTALAALALRATAAPLEAAAVSSAVLVGADENGLDPEAADNPGAVHVRSARLVRRGGSLAADVLALTTAAAAAGALLGVPVLAAEGILVVLLALGVALLVAGAGAVLPAGGEDEHGAVRWVRGHAPALAGGVGVVVAAALWLPSRYADLRFAHVGLDTFTDQAVVGVPTPRSELEPQILELGADLGQVISTTDEARASGALLDVLALYTVSPSAVAAGALGLGVLLALGALLLGARAGTAQGAGVLRAARTHRTGGALGTVSGIGSAALATTGLLGLLVLAAGVLSVLGAGVPGLVLFLTAVAGLGGLLVVVGASATAVADGLAGPDAPGVTAGVDHDAAPAAARLLVGVLPALALLGPVVTALQLAPRAATLWEDRALHAVTPVALPVLAGLVLGAVSLLGAAAILLEASRRAATAAVVETRSALLAGRDRLDLEDVAADVRRGVLPAVVLLLLLPVVAGFGLGPAALPAYVAGSVVAAAGLGLWTLGARTVAEGALATVSAGRYGGPGSWAHSGALGGAVLAGILRSAVGSLALPVVLTGSALGALAVSAVVGAVVDGTDPILRWGVALLALLVVVTCVVVARAAPEVDLEDGEGERSRPLFARDDADAEEDTLDAMSWEADERR